MPFNIHMEADDDDRPIDRPAAEPLSRMIARRTVLKGVAGLGLAAGLPALAPSPAARAAPARAGGNPSTLGFVQPAHEITDGHRVAAGYHAEVLIRWGGPLFADAPPFRPGHPTAAAQARQFGYNNDFTAFMPLPVGSANSDHGLLCVNHEYTNPELMWPGLTRRDGGDLTADRVAVEMAAHGHSVIEVRKANNRWRVVADGPFARRITATTPIGLSGPAAGTARLRTADDPTGRRVLGTVNNCAGGKTPWGTVLSAEENIHHYFRGDPAMGDEAANHARMGIPAKRPTAWGRHIARFDVEREPHEPNRFGWVVEIDPYGPASLPVKRTALGRFKHEGATVALAADGRAVVYSGDDQKFEYLYRFVSRDPVDMADRSANRDLLDFGTLFVARFNEGGQLDWLPLVWNDGRSGGGPLTPANGFKSQADVLIETRRAADLLGATPLDRPEDVEADPATGKVYAMLTNNSRRGPDQVDAANPRAHNTFGHILELTPPPGPTGAPDHAADGFGWDVFLLAGDPGDAAQGARYNPAQGDYGSWLAAPDNCAFDARGRLWIATDQGWKQARSGVPDGLYATDVSGPGRALTRLFLTVPRGAEMCGPEFTPDGRTLFCAVQHPGEGSTFDAPATRWPDFDPHKPPRPAVLAITRDDSGLIGG